MKKKKKELEEQVDNDLELWTTTTAWPTKDRSTKRPVKPVNASLNTPFASLKEQWPNKNKQAATTLCFLLLLNIAKVVLLQVEDFN